MNVFIYGKQLHISPKFLNFKYIPNCLFTILEIFMKKLALLLLMVSFIMAGCGKSDKAPEEAGNENTITHEELKSRLAAYAEVEFNRDNIDISHLSERQIQMIAKLTEAGEIIDELFWHQSTPEGIKVRDSLAALDTEEAQDFLHYVNINYGPYDVIHDQTRFVGSGPETRPECGGFYPVDMTKAEFENHIANNSVDAEAFKSQYTIITRDEDKALRAVPYHELYAEQIEALAVKLEEAAELCDNESLKNYLLLRAEAVRTDEYFESDLVWMELEGNDVDLVIGPIENYEDGLFNYKTAFECVIMVKDPAAGKALQDFKDNMNYFQQNLPTKDKYKELDLGEGNVIQAVNAVYFGGDCKKGTKTIAAALPNDPKVAEAKGRKLSMYINHMQAKFNKIVVPIAQVLLTEEWAAQVDATAFTNFVTLHEVSHATGPKYINGGEEDIRGALKDRYSAIEETKADILSMYNHKLLADKGYFTPEYIKKAQATYVAGLYRSIRFGTGAHCTANYIQLNYLQKFGAIEFIDGKFSINEDIFFNGVEKLAALILDIEANGNYDGAGKIIATYGNKTPEIKANIERLKDLPRDIDTYYNF